MTLIRWAKEKTAGKNQLSLRGLVYYILFPIILIAMLSGIFFGYYDASARWDQEYDYQANQFNSLMDQYRNDLLRGSDSEFLAQLQKEIKALNISHVLVEMSPLEKVTIVNQPFHASESTLGAFTANCTAEQSVGIIAVLWSRCTLRQSVIYYDVKGTKPLAKVKWDAGKNIIAFLYLRIFFSIVVFSFFGGILSMMAKTYLKKYLSDPLSLLSKELSAGNIDIISTMQSHKRRETIKEVDLVFKGIEELRMKISSYQAQIITQEKQAALVNVATQVAHDIRSPLSSIQAAVGLLQNPEASKDDALNLLALSSRRIEGIASDLLEKHKGQGMKENIFSLHRVLDELIGELETSPIAKGVCFKKEYGTALSCYGERSKLQRVFGNIVKNALEALNGSGIITLKTSVEGEYSMIQIQDNGRGMSPETLSKILQGGHSEGKKEGHGIGMKVVLETIEEHMGQLEAESTLGKGTTFTIKLPLPESIMIKNTKGLEQGVGTFELSLSPCAGESRDEGIIVIDDDTGMRLQWELLLKKEGLAVHTFDSYEAYSKNKPKGCKVGIIDFHFENSELNGIQILEKLKGENFTHLTLCTAEYWKPSIQLETKRLNVTVCPKPLPRITFHIDSSPSSFAKASADGQGEMESHKENGYTVLVIDDDKLIGITWKSMKKSLKIKDLYYFPNLEKCLEAKINFAQIDIAFVDKNIEGSDYDGESTMAYLKKQNLNKVLMATGETGTKIPESLAGFLPS